MAYSGRLQNIQAEINSIQEELLPISRGAVFIKDPSKRRKCPICQQNIYLYHMNYEEMFLMCENSLCEFPFGYEAIQIVRHENELQDTPAKATRDFYEYPTEGANYLSRSLSSILGAPTGTISSMSFVSDSDALSQIGDNEDLDKQENLSNKLSKRDIKRRKQEQKSKEVQLNINRIKELTEEMNILIQNDSETKGIKNHKWLKILKTWQEQTGHKYLTDTEHKELVKSEHKSTDSDLKISVDLTQPTNENLTVNIKILSVEGESQNVSKKVGEGDE